MVGACWERRKNLGQLVWGNVQVDLPDDMCCYNSFLTPPLVISLLAGTCQFPPTATASVLGVSGTTLGLPISESHQVLQVFPPDVVPLHPFNRGGCHRCFFTISFVLSLDCMVSSLKMPRLRKASGEGCLALAAHETIVGTPLQMAGLACGLPASLLLGGCVLLLFTILRDD